MDIKESEAYKPHEIEKLLTATLIDKFVFILEYSPQWAREFLKVYTTKFEVVNIKRLLRYLYSKANINLTEVVNLRAQEILGRTAFISDLLQSENLADIIERLKNSEYGSEISLAEDLYAKVGDIWPFEIAIDSHYLKKLIKSAKS